MDTINRLNEKINNIGCQMVKCTKNCAGIAKPGENDIIPMCLYLEDTKDNSTTGTIIVGINPGNATKKEREYYYKHGHNYENVVNYWKKYVQCKHQYYKKLRAFVNGLGFNGHILWTELVKCANDKNEQPPLQTFRTCCSEYLNEEIKAVPGDWPIIGAGRKAYEVLTFLYPKRTIIGVPHPTGSWGYFEKLFKGKSVKPEMLKPELLFDKCKCDETQWATKDGYK